MGGRREDDSLGFQGFKFNLGFWVMCYVCKCVNIFQKIKKKIKRVLQIRGPGLGIFLRSGFGPVKFKRIRIRRVYIFRTQIRENGYGSTDPGRVQYPLPSLHQSYPIMTCLHNLVLQVKATRQLEQGKGVEGVRLVVQAEGVVSLLLKGESQKRTFLKQYQPKHRQQRNNVARLSVILLLFWKT